MPEPFAIEAAVELVTSLFATEQWESAVVYLNELHPADSAEVMTRLPIEQQITLTALLNVEAVADIFEQMDEDEAMDVAQSMQMEVLADVLDEMEPDMAADLLAEFSDDEAAVLLDEMEDSAEVRPLMAYPEESAGGIMNLVGPMLRRHMLISEALAFMRTHYQSEKELHYLYVLNRHTQLVGVLSLRSFILAQPEQTVEEVMNSEVISIQVDADQEEVAQMLARYDLVALPVVDKNRRLLGEITVDDVVDVLEDEATEDIYRLAQVSAEAEIFSSIPRAIRNRLPWLLINLGTAFLASSVVSYFEGTIARAALLAAFMPIVAGQGGNAGTQTMTIVVRSLALGELNSRDTWSALWHEFRVGLIHGVVLGILVGLLAWLWKGNPVLGLVIGVAMLGNLLVAALAGVIVPMTLKALRVDPALASSVFVTTATDVLGFGLFLGLATYLLAWLVV